MTAARPALWGEGPGRGASCPAAASRAGVLGGRPVPLLRPGQGFCGGGVLSRGRVPGRGSGGASCPAAASRAGVLGGPQGGRPVPRPPALGPALGARGPL